MNEAMRRAAEAQILRVMLDDPARPQYAYDLMEATRQGSETLYPALVNLDRAGLVIMQQEPDERAAGHSRRRTYKLNPDVIDDAQIRVMELNLEAT